MNKVLLLLTISILCVNLAFAQESINNPDIEALKIEIVDFNKKVLFEENISFIDYYNNFISILERYEAFVDANLVKEKDTFDRAFKETQELIELKRKKHGIDGANPSAEELMQEFYTNRPIF